MKPIRERRPSPDWAHEKKKNGECRKDCKQCEEDEFEDNALNDPNHNFHHLYVCREKGKDGSPTLDHAGYELDYNKVCNWFKPTSVRSLKPSSSKEKKYEENMGRENKEYWEMMHHFFEEGAEPDSWGVTKQAPFDTIYAIKERVEQDLGVLWHKVKAEDVKEWEKKGFKKAKKGEYVEFSQVDRDRFTKKLSGACLRK